MPKCPTYELLGSENDGPRGRIALIKAMYESKSAPHPSTVFHLDRCLSCSACMSTCAAGVDYRRIIDDARAHIEKTFKRPVAQRLQRLLVLLVLPRPWLLRSLLFLARMVPAGLVSSIPERLRPFIKTALDLPRTGSYGAKESHVGGVRSSAKRLFLLQGCVQQVVAPRTNDAAERLFGRNGFAVVRSVSANCCGALALHMGRPDRARRQAEAVLDEFERRRESGFSAVFATATGCGAVLKEYGELFRGTSHEKLATEFGSLARDPIEILAEWSKPLEARREARFQIAVHEPCSLRFVQRISGAYERVLTSVGMMAAPAPEGHMCCGSAGSYSLLEPDISEQLGKRKAAQIESVKAPVVVSANVGCLTQLGRFLAQRPLHAIEVLDWINGGPQPPELAGWEQWQSLVPDIEPSNSNAVW